MRFAHAWYCGTCYIYYYGCDCEVFGYINYQPDVQMDLGIWMEVLSTLLCRVQVPLMDSDAAIFPHGHGMRACKMYM